MSKQFNMKTKSGYDFGVAASAIQKCVRRGDEEKAMYWFLEFAEQGLDKYIWRRLCIMAAEDIGLANIFAIVSVNQNRDSWMKAKEAGQLHMSIGARTIQTLCRSPKSRENDDLAYYVDTKIDDGLDLSKGAVTTKEQMIEALTLAVAKGAEFPAAFWAGKLQRDKENTAIWTVLDAHLKKQKDKQSPEYRMVVDACKGVWDYILGQKKVPELNIYCHALLVLMRSPGIQTSIDLWKTVTEKRKAGHRELLMSSYIDGHTTQGKQIIAATAKEEGVKPLAIQARVFYYDSGRLDRHMPHHMLYMGSGERSWSANILEFFKLSPEKYYAPAPEFTVFEPAAAKEIEILPGEREGTYKVPSFSDPDIVYDVDIVAGSCTCPHYKKGNRCKHLQTVEARFSAPAPKPVETTVERQGDGGNLYMFEDSE